MQSPVPVYIVQPPRPRKRDSVAALLAALAFCAPVGIVMLWTRRGLSRPTRIAGTAVSLGLFLVGLVGQCNTAAELAAKRDAEANAAARAKSNEAAAEAASASVAASASAQRRAELAKLRPHERAASLRQLCTDTYCPHEAANDLIESAPEPERKSLRATYGDRIDRNREAMAYAARGDFITKWQGEMLEKGKRGFGADVVGTHRDGLSIHWIGCSDTFVKDEAKRMAEAKKLGFTYVHCFDTVQNHRFDL